jgi:hypothetical protein
MTDELPYERRDGIGHITFNRPGARNALTFSMYERLTEIATNPGDVRPDHHRRRGQGFRRRNRHQPIPSL